MKKLRKDIRNILGILLILFSCGRKEQSHFATGPQQSESTLQSSDLQEEAKQWADSITEILTLRQKISQLFLPAVYSTSDPYSVKKIQEYKDSMIGGVVLLKGDTAGAHKLSSVMGNSIIPPLICIDAEWGLAMRLKEAHRFPRNSQWPNTISENEMYEYGREVARECLRLGINVVLGPVVDVSAPGGEMGSRSFGPDPHRVADMAVAYARGVESGGVMTVAKHFPGLGAVGGDTHAVKPRSYKTLHQMDSIDLYPFKRWIEEGLSAVMVGHVAIPSIDPEELPSAVSPTIITDLLRIDLGFNGLVFTDALNMKGAESHSALEAILAGADLIIAPNDTKEEIKIIEMAVLKSRISEQTIDNHLRRVLKYKFLINRTP